MNLDSTMSKLMWEFFLEEKVGLWDQLCEISKEVTRMLQ